MGAANTGSASTGWTARTAPRESAREMAADQVADLRASAVFALVPGSSAPAAQGPFVVERKGIKDGSVRRGWVPAGALTWLRATRGSPSLPGRARPCWSSSTRGRGRGQDAARSAAGPAVRPPACACRAPAVLCGPRAPGRCCGSARRPGAVLSQAGLLGPGDQRPGGGPGRALPVRVRRACGRRGRGHPRGGARVQRRVRAGCWPAPPGPGRRTRPRGRRSPPRPAVRGPRSAPARSG